jgi:hypothetical protein
MIEIVLYGVWLEQRGAWWIELSGIPFHTPSIGLARVQASLCSEPCHVAMIGADGKPKPIEGSGPSEHK